MSYINHELLRRDKVVARPYQVELAIHASETSTLVVIPTGLGKTIVAVLVAMTRLPVGKVLFLAPTNPLVEQHVESLRATFVDLVDVALLNGQVKPSTRKDIFDAPRMQIIVATPQTVANDLMAGRIDLSGVSLVIYDEAHHGVGQYDYTTIAARYAADRPKDALSLGITASPGYEEEHIQVICDNLHLAQVRSKSEQDETVRPFVQKTPVDVIMVDQEPKMVEARRHLTAMLGETLQELGLPLTTPTKDILQMLQQARARQDRLTLFFLAKVRKLQQAILVADTQGPAPLQKYLIGLDTDGSKAAESIRRDYRASKALSLAAGVRIGAKQQKVIKLITNQILTKPDSKILLFCSYRATVEAMVDTLDLAASLADFKIAPGVLVGQTKGMSQKKQQEALQKFREGQINVLVATQVGEEGLDIPAVDLVIHYEPVASGKRSIQRDGRTGRNRPGRIAIIATKDTMDEWMLINSYRRRKSMKVALTGMED